MICRPDNSFFFFFGLFILQRVSEKVGGAEGTKLDVDFTEMEKARLHSHVHIITLLFNNFQKLLHLLSKLCWTNMDHLKRTLVKNPLISFSYADVTVKTLKLWRHVSHIFAPTLNLN